MGQLDLFAKPEAKPPVDDEVLRTVASRIPAHVRLGTSSWTFAGWKGLIYRRDYESTQQFNREALSEYGEYPLFRTVGVDRAFYQPVPEEELVDYAAQVPAQFRFVQKVWARVASPLVDIQMGGERKALPNSDFLNPEVFLQTQVEPSRRALGPKLGPFVLEISPSRGQLARETFEPKLLHFLAALPRDLQIAVELREATLLSERYFAVLAETGAVHCLNVWTNMPSLRRQLQHPRTTDGSFALARLLLPQGRQYQAMKERFAPFDRIVEPAHEVRAHVLELIERTRARGTETYIIVNNKLEGSSPLTVRALAERMGS